MQGSAGAKGPSAGNNNTTIKRGLIYVISKNKSRMELLLMMLPYGAMEKCAMTAKAKQVANLSPIIQDMIRDGLIKESTVEYREKDNSDSDRYYLSDRWIRLGKKTDSGAEEELRQILGSDMPLAEMLDLLVCSGYVNIFGKRPYGRKGNADGRTGEPDEQSEKRRKEGKRVYDSFLVITPKGINYLLDHAADAEGARPLIDQLREMDYSTSIFGSLASNVKLSNIRHQTVTGFFRIAGIDCFCGKPLADGLYFIPKSDDATFSGAVLQAASLINNGEKEYPMLYDVRDVKQIGTINNTSTDKSHYSLVTATHFLLTPARKYIVYKAKKSGTGLEYTTHLKTVGLLHQLLNFTKDNRGTSMHPVIILASNISEYRKCVEKGLGAEKVSLVKKMAGRESFGHPAEGYYVIPINYNGSQIIKYMISHEKTPGSNYEKDLLEDAIRELGLTDVTVDRARPMSFEHDHIRYCIGYDMNIQRILRFDRAAGRSSTTQHVLLIRKWQQPYLESYVKNAKLEIVE